MLKTEEHFFVSNNEIIKFATLGWPFKIVETVGSLEFSTGQNYGNMIEASDRLGHKVSKSLMYARASNG